MLNFFATMRHLAIFEPHTDGHRMQFVHYIARAAAARGATTHLYTLPWAAEHPAVTEMSHELREAIRITPLAVPNRLIAPLRSANPNVEKFALWSAANRANELIPEDFTLLVPFMNVFDLPVALLGSPFRRRPWNGITLREIFHQRAMGLDTPRRKQDPFKEWQFRRILGLPSLKTMFTIDEFLPVYARKKGFRSAEKIVHVYDPVSAGVFPEQAEARLYFGARLDANVLLVYGIISPRKNIGSLLQALAELPNGPTLLMVGRQDASLGKTMHGPAAETLRQQKRLIEVNRFVSKEEEGLAYAACDVVWAGYAGHFASSAVLLHACAAKKPTITSNVGITGLYAKKYGVALGIESGDPEQIKDAVNQVFGNPLLYSSMTERADLVAKKHDVSQFTKSILDHILGDH